MTTITLRINERTKMGKIILDLIKLSSSEKKGVEVLHVPNEETLEAIKEAEEGKTTKTTLSEFRKQLY
ncbi:MAG: hypothetical protein V4622_13685 [Bacteroidota bacterium]